MKLIKLLTLPIITLIGVSSLFGCGEEEYVQNLWSTTADIATFGKQELTISFSSYHQQEISTFKDTIAIEDITFKDDLVGRTCTSVTYVSSSYITLVLEGDSSSISTATSYGQIRVAGKAIVNGVGGFCTFNVTPPKIYVTAESVSYIGNKLDCSASYKMLSGAFSDDITDTINYEETSGTMTYTKEGDIVKVKIVNFLYTAERPLPHISFLVGSNNLGIVALFVVGG